MFLSWKKSRNTFLVLLGITILLVVMILSLHQGGDSSEKEILAVVVASLGFFISVSAARLVMNSEMLSLRYMLDNAIRLDRCAKELGNAALRMRKGSADRFRTACQAAEAMNLTGRSGEAVEMLHRITMERPEPARSTEFLSAAMRYSLMKGDTKAAADYLGKLKTAAEGLPKGISRETFEKDIRTFSSFIQGDMKALERRFREGSSALVRLEAAMLLRDKCSDMLREECTAFIADPEGKC